MIQLHKLLKYHKKIEYTSNIFGISRPEIVFYKKEGSKTKYSLVLYTSGFVNFNHIYIQNRNSICSTRLFHNESMYCFNQYSRKEHLSLSDLSKPFYKKFYGL